MMHTILKRLYVSSSLGHICKRQGWLTEKSAQSPQTPKRPLSRVPRPARPQATPRPYRSDGGRGRGRGLAARVSGAINWLMRASRCPFVGF